MSNITQFFGSGGVERKKNRKIFHGGVAGGTYTWGVPPDTTEVEVHCWGAGGDGSGNSPPSPANNGGGGGGYVTHVFPVSSSDRLLITVGSSPGGTSSVSVPTQSPISPISATGGSTNPSGGGVGGSGSYTIAPGISTSRTFSSEGGDGGTGTFFPTIGSAGHGGGGSAGSPFGSKGGNGAPAGSDSSGGGGGIGGPAIPTHGGGTLGSKMGKDLNADSGDWFYVDEILGYGGADANPIGGDGGAGAGGGGAGPRSSPPTSFSPYSYRGGDGGFLGGGGGGYTSLNSASPRAGLAGGGGGNSYGGAGVVIIYW